MAACGGAERAALVKLPLLPMLLAVTCGIAVAAFCALCATKPTEVAAYIRNRYSTMPKWVKHWPFANLVTKEWYPTYLRVAGIGGFVFAQIWLSLLIRQFSK